LPTNAISWETPSRRTVLLLRIIRPAHKTGPKHATLWF